MRQGSAFERNYFVGVSAILVFLTTAAFSDNLFTRIDQPSNSDPKFIVHGLFCAAWMILLLAQTSLVRSSRTIIHRRVGIAGLFIAAGVVLSTLWVFVAVWKGWSLMTPEVKANRLLLVSYLLFLWWGYRNRARPDRHRRFMLVATFFMLEPVLARDFDPLFVPLLVGWSEPQIESAFLPFLFASWIALFASLVLYDWVQQRRVHQVTFLGMVWFALVWAAAMLL